MIRGLVLCLALALPVGASSQEEETPAVEALTLEQALTRALVNNTSVQNAVLDVDKAGEHVAVARTRRLPELMRSQRQQVAEEVKQPYYGIQQTESALGALAETLTFLRELDYQIEQYVKA